MTVTELLDFNEAGITPEQIARLRLSIEGQRRLDQLLEKKQAGLGGLNDAEQLELDEYLQFESAMRLMKAQAAKAIRSDSAA